MSIQNEQDRQVRVKEMAASAGSSKPACDNVEEGSDIAPTSDIPLSTLDTIDVTII